MWIMLDEVSFYIFLGLTTAFFILLIVNLIIFGKMPPAARAIISCWLKKRTLVIDTDDSGLFIFKAFKKGGDEGQLERKAKKGYTEVKTIPRHSNPLVSTRYYLEKTGIPTFLSYMGKIMVATPKMLAAMRVAKMKKGLPKFVIEWAKENKIPVEVLKETVAEVEGEKKTVIVPEEVEKDLFSIDPRELKEFYRETWDEGAIKIRLRQEYQRGYRDRGTQVTKLLIPVGLIFVALIIIMFVVPWLSKSGMV